MKDDDLASAAVDVVQRFRVDPFPAIIEYGSAQDVLRCDYQSERHCSKTRGAEGRLAPGAITSQNDTAPKRPKLCIDGCRCAITSQNDTAPKLSVSKGKGEQVRLPVRTTLLQNGIDIVRDYARVRLPVRTTLLQNRPARGYS